MTEETIRTIGGAIVSSLPVFGVLFITQRMTNQFNKGWYDAMHGNREYAETNEFRCSLLWSIPFSMFAIGLVVVILYSFDIDDKFLTVLYIPITLFLIAFTLHVTTLKIKILDAKLVVNSVFTRKELNFSEIAETKALAGYLVVTKKNKKTFKVPLFFSNLMLLGHNLRKATHEIH
jgi:hypothetical protein